MMKQITIVILLVLGFSFCSEAKTYYSKIEGKVECEGSGIKGVVVTDGFACVQTDGDGKYTLPITRDSKYVYLSTPAGYVTGVEKQTLPIFYQELEQDKNTYNFQLIRNSKDDSKHAFIVQTDVQMTSEENLNSYDTIVTDIKKHAEVLVDYDLFGFDCGDIVGDTPSLFPPYIEKVSKLDFPIYRAIGNHDMDYWGRSHETSTKTFEKYFGPTRYSFNKGNAHYIVINNNFFIGREYFYIGYIDENTFRWMEQDLSYVREGSPVFVVMHIPSRVEKEQQPFEYSFLGVVEQNVNTAPLHKMLEPYNAHIISGHTHYNQNFNYSDSLMEHITGAVCGTWWLGDICQDGTPQGYSVYTVDEDKIEWYYKSASRSKEHQFRAYKMGSSHENPNDIVANVWNWDEAWKVEWLENEKVMGEMEMYEGYDPAAYELTNDKEKITYDWISPQKTKHMFKAKPKDKNAKLAVKVTDRFGNVYTENIN